MAVKEFNWSPNAEKTGVVKNAATTAVGAGAANLGGTGVRVLVDDATVLSKLDVTRALQTIEQRIVEDTWPPA